MKNQITLLFFISQIFFCQIVFAQTERGVGNIRGERKIALVIGNTDYDARVGRLKNPVNDARDVAAALQRLGFTLVGGKAQVDVNRRQMLELIREFGSQIKRGGVGFFYFSGHGVQVNKRNYVIPITDSLVYEDDAESEAVEVDAVVREMEYAENRLNILVLDACRNNNLLKRGRNSEKGLTEPGRKPRGTFIAFAADDGQTASDNSGGRNGLFTQELLKHLETPNVRLDDIFRTVRSEVERLSRNSQSPMIIDKTNEAITLHSTNDLNVNTALRPQIDNPSNAAPTQTQLQTQTPGGTQSQTQSQSQIFNGTQTQSQSQRPNGTQTQTQSQTAQPQINVLPGASENENSLVKEMTLDYENESKIGSGEKEFTVKWSSCSDDCVYAYSDKLDGIANSKVTNFAEIGDFTGYDRSSRVRKARLNQILVLRNPAGYYALVQMTRISDKNKQLTIRYKIIPDKRASAWKQNRGRYVSSDSSGRIRFIFEDNDGDFVIGEGDKKFNLQFGGLGKGKVRLYNDDGISLISVEGSGEIVDGRRIAELEIGDRVIIANKNGHRAVIKILDAETEGYSSDVDEVFFEYQISGTN